MRMSEIPPVPEPSRPSGNWWQRKSKLKKVLWSLAAVFVALIAIAIAFPAEDDGEDAAPTTATETTETETTEPQPTEPEPEPTEPEPTKTSPPPSSSNRATDGNEPHVGRNGRVIVDTLTWRVLSVRQASELGSDFSREKPDGFTSLSKRGSQMARTSP